jgi:hypothetical protein
MSYRYEGIEINPLDFAKSPQFEMDTGLISNVTTRDLITQSSINKHIFKILMSTLRKPKRKPTGTVTQSLIDDVIEIADKIEKKTKLIPEIKESGFPTFEEYYQQKLESSWKIQD